MIKLPTRLNQLLAQDNGLNAFVLKAMTVIEPWARDNKTIFFPEYTDHSLVHLSEVLGAADSLISDSSWIHLTAEDAAVLSIAVLLHDCALHISEEGFYCLIEGRYNASASRYAEAGIKWEVLWGDFLAESRRFDQRKLIALFGSTDPISAFPENKLDLTLRHRLLAGEFLRRHHARLAHEIALSGIPGPNNPFPIADDAHHDLVDLAGYVARSHNLSIRTAVDRIESSKRRVHLNCRVPFVMVILRIADYLQIHSSRAPGQLLRLKSLASPISRGEWKKHEAVKEINQAHEDPEAIFVDCEPDSAATFAGMQRLLKDIQGELDQSWAVMGEVYGRFKPLEELGITIRRVRSNIDDPAQYQVHRKPAYLPKEYKFQTASAELMDLLVAPLYGEKPEVGIRELVQNAVDACLERDDLVEKGLVQIDEEPSEDVTVTIFAPENGQASIVIDDFGVGMTPAVVENYFLNIGASFRSSDLWRKNHEVAGHSTIHRTGRFGIGILAAYLLGKEIKVTTRHISSPPSSGITFTCKQGDESIEVRPCVFRFGTRIEIDIPDAVVTKLLQSPNIWDWYCLEQPRVHRKINRKGDQVLQQRYEVPGCDADLSSTKWRRIDAEGYDDLMWSYEAIGGVYYNRVIVCNGIYISSSAYQLTPRVSSGLNVIRVDTPSLVVFDPDGRFPINLQRNQVLSESVGFQRLLAVDVSHYLTGKLVEIFEQTVAGVNKKSVANSIDPKIPGLGGLQQTSLSLANVLLKPKGVLPVDLDLLREVKPDVIAVDAVNLAANRGAFNSSAFVEWVENYVAADAVTYTKSSRTDFLRNSMGMSTSYGHRTGYFYGLPIVGRRLLLRKSDVVELVTPGNVPRAHWGKLKLEADLDKWGLWSVGTLPPLTLDVGALCAQLEASQSFGITLLYMNWAEDKDREGPCSPFAEAWKQAVPSAVLSQRLRAES